MRLFAIAAGDDEIRQAVADWSEALAEGRFVDALAMFPFRPGEEMTPDELREWIANYGFDEPMRDGSRWQITTLLGRSDAAEIIRDKIEVDRDNPYGLDGADYLGMVHYGHVPLNGERSDLTARFGLRRVDPAHFTLEFWDIHVM